MKAFDIFLTLLLPSLIVVHLLVAPYTKVEESFNIQAAHDILVHGIPTHDVSQRLQANFDHVEFPGAVPRTFLGAVVLSGISQPVLFLTDGKYGQFVVRAVLGLFNAVALLKYRGQVGRAFGRTAARWFVLLLAGQFHILFYASRTLPNMFAFGLTTLALSAWLPVPTSTPEEHLQRHKLGVYYFVLAGVLFRSELALMLGTHLLWMLLSRSTPLSMRTLIPIGLSAAILALVISVPIDSYFWQRPIWPEFSGFVFNAVQGKSSEWGTSPLHAYFTNFLPKLLLNPVILLVGIPVALSLPSSKSAALNLLVPNLAFVAIYSLQPHKEARFIIYVIPPLTTIASITAAYVTTHRRSFIYGLLYLVFGASILLSLAASTSMLLISSLNYPGGEALYILHTHLRRTPQTHPVKVHLDIPACMTGVTRFQQDHPTPPVYTLISNLILPKPISQTAESALIVQYDKTEEQDKLLDPSFWKQFDYLITSSPETSIGSWEVVSTIYGYAGIEFLKPGQTATQQLPVHSMQYAELALGNRVVEGETEREMRELRAEVEGWMATIKELGFYGCLREGSRRFLTRGWWLGPRMEAKIWVLKRSRTEGDL